MSPSPAIVSLEELDLRQEAYLMDLKRSFIVLRALREASEHRGWALLAAHVRSSHVHVVIRAEGSPEPVMNTIKSYASRALNEMKVDPAGRVRWSRHGSTRYLWKPEDVGSAVN